jgi:osmotically-inducible protein OsmY
MLTQNPNGKAAASAIPTIAPVQEVMDARQESQIWTAYALSASLRHNDLKVSVRDGKATLAGFVGDSVHQDLAKQIALKVAGITAVESHIEIRPNFTSPAVSAEPAFGEMVDDATITCTVRSKLLWSRHGEELAAHVDTARGRVSLTGIAESIEARDMAGKLAANTHGVSSVDNQLSVESPRAGVARSEASNVIDITDVADGWITTKVKLTFLYSTNVSRSSIQVTTQGGIVKLTGKLDSVAERAAAIALAANVRGVRSVDADSLTM